MTELRRHIGLIGLTLFGVGDILGAGIYGLVGRAAGEMGHGIWMAFLVSALAAGLTGLSYATLGSRYPRAAGAAYVIDRAFAQPWLAYIVGLSVCASGLTSMATAAKVLAGYAGVWSPELPSEFWVGAFVLAMGVVVWWGIRESLLVNAVCTVIEVAGLLIVIGVGLTAIGSVDYFDMTTSANPSGDLFAGMILSGAVLTFYSFVGFEDILNVSEEVRDPARVVPRGLLAAVVISAVIYILVSLVAVSVVPPHELANSAQPLVDVVQRRAPWFPPEAFRLIALFAVSNTLLLNFVMSTRLIYGMARQKLLPAPLAGIHPKRRTPHIATALVLIVVLTLALTADVSQLARATSVLLLVCFLLMNAALARLQMKRDEPRGHFEAPRWVPCGGIVICLLLLSHTKGSDWMVAGTLLAAILVLYFIQHPARRLIDRFPR